MELNLVPDRIQDALSMLEREVQKDVEGYIYCRTNGFGHDECAKHIPAETFQKIAMLNCIKDCTSG